MKSINERRKKRNTFHEVDKTFNRLKELQALIKKEAALKELCKEKIY
jgi:hypothetical protein